MSADSMRNQMLGAWEAGWEAHAAFVDSDPKKIVLNLKAPVLSEDDAKELTDTVKRMIAARTKSTVLTHYVAPHWRESPGFNGEVDVVMSVCGKKWKPSKDAVSEGECQTCRAIVESGWMK